MATKTLQGNPCSPTTQIPIIFISQSSYSNWPLTLVNTPCNRLQVVCVVNRLLWSKQAVSAERVNKYFIPAPSARESRSESSYQTSKERERRREREVQTTPLCGSFKSVHTRQQLMYSKPSHVCTLSVMFYLSYKLVSKGRLPLCPCSLDPPCKACTEA